jgi:hypothetical protein
MLTAFFAKMRRIIGHTRGSKMLPMSLIADRYNLRGTEADDAIRGRTSSCTSQAGEF